MRARAANAVLVLRDVGQVRKIAEGADDLGGSFDREPVQHGFELQARGLILVAMEADRGFSDALDGLEDVVAFLGADRVAEYPAKQPDVLTQRQVLVRQLGLGHRTNRSRARSVNGCETPTRST